MTLIVETPKGRKQTELVARGPERVDLIGPLGLDALIRAAMELVESGVPVREAGRAVLHLHRPDAEAAAALIERGLLLYIHDHLGMMRQPPVQDDERASLLSRFQLRSPHGRAMAEDILRRLIYEGADGHQKMLMAFTAADAEQWVTIANARAAGWRKKAKAMQSVAKVLREDGAATVGDLAPDRLAAVRATVEGAWL